MVAVRRPSSPTACATPATSGRRAGAPGRVSTARSSQITTVSSMKTESGQSSAAGACSTAQPLALRAATYAACCTWGSDTSTGMRVMCVMMPSASLLLGWRTKPVPFTLLWCHRHLRDWVRLAVQARAVAPDRGDVAGRGDVGARVAVDEQEVGAQPAGDAAPVG